MLRRSLAASLLLALAACSESAPPPPEETPEVVIALQRDFEGFLGWEKFFVSDDPIPGHPTGTRVVYLNKRPPKGSAEFPVGTMIVKASDIHLAPTWWEIHAMVKRGGGFNSAGGEWEWFELVLTEDETPVIRWRGSGPPPDAGYGPGGEQCNGCHESSAANDYVKSPPLSLGTL